MYSTIDLQKLVQMLSYLGIIGPGSYPAHSVVLGANQHATPGVTGTLLASNGASADPSFQTLAALGIQAALGYTPAHAGVNADITSLSSPSLGSATASTAVVGTNTNQVATTAFVAAHSPIVNILDHGGDNTGVADNSAALTAAISACISGHAAVFFPAGTYAFSAQFAYTMPAVSFPSILLMGAGPEQTILTWAAGGGIKISLSDQFSGVHIRDMSLTTGAVGAGSAIQLVQTAASIPNPANTALSDITNVTIRGTDGLSQNKYWLYGIELNGISNVNMANVMVAGNNTSPHLGTGLWIHGTAALPPNVFSVIGSTFNFLGIGINYGDWVQGVEVVTGNFTGTEIGIFSAASLNVLVQLAVTNSQFNCFQQAILLNTEIPDLIINGNLFFIPGPSSGTSEAIALVRADRYSITGNSLTGYNTISNINGITINTCVSKGVITGNSFNGMGFGIVLQAASTGNNIQSNVYSSVTTPVTNLGAGNTVGGGSL